MKMHYRTHQQEEESQHIKYNSGERPDTPQPHDSCLKSAKLDRCQRTQTHHNDTAKTNTEPDPHLKLHNKQHLLSTLTQFCC